MDMDIGLNPGNIISYRKDIYLYFSKQYLYHPYNRQRIAGKLELNVQPFGQAFI
jgi:hypothetical protein